MSNLILRRGRRLGIVFFVCSPVSVPVSCIRFVSVVACAAKCDKPCDTPIDVGLFRGFYTEHNLPLSQVGFSNPMTYDEYRERHDRLYSELGDEYNARLQGTRERDQLKKMQLTAEYVTKGAVQGERLSHERLNQEHAQIQLARSVTRISPVAIVQHLIEAFAGTGFERHRTIRGERATLRPRIPRIRRGYG